MRSLTNDIIAKVSAVQPSLIFMDNWLPGTGGLNAVQQIKGAPELCDIPIVYFSANFDIEKLSSGAGADAYLAKTFDIKDLVALAKSFTDKSQLFL